MQWWYTCRNDSCLHDFLRTINTVSMKSSTCLAGGGLDNHKQERRRSVAVLTSCPTFDKSIDSLIIHTIILPHCIFMQRNFAGGRGLGRSRVRDKRKSVLQPVCRSQPKVYTPLVVGAVTDNSGWGGELRCRNFSDAWSHGRAIHSSQRIQPVRTTARCNTALPRAWTNTATHGSRMPCTSHLFRAPAQKKQPCRHVGTHASHQGVPWRVNKPTGGNGRSATIARTLEM